MFKSILANIFNKALAIIAVGAAVSITTSCESIYDDLDPCPQGVRLRFVYDYNMEFANAFPSQVDCLTVLFYDENGRYVTTRTNTTDELHDENYRMTVDLAPGTYTIVSYGGMACEDASFHYVTDPATTALRDIRVALNDDCLTSPVGTNLHPLFYGKIDVEIESTDMTYREYTVKMMKDTNNLRVILQQIDGDPLDNADFDWMVTDNNTLFAWNNDIIPQTPVEYLPWARGNASPGDLPDGTPASVCWAEMSFSRLVTGNEPHLVITRRSDGYQVIDIPLINYLGLMKSEAYESMPLQEFLDRESRWDMIFFLDRNHAWLKTQIIVNDWVVRLNDIDV